MKKILDLLESEVSEQAQNLLLDDISGDPALTDSWEQYHLLGAVLRKEHHGYNQGFSERVRMRIDNESNLLAPNNFPKGRDSHRLDSSPGTRLNRRIIPALAMAASIAAIAVIGLPFTTYFDEVAPSSVAATGSSRWQTAQPEFESRLNEYLVEHGEFSTTPNMNGLTAYAKFVSYDSTR